MANQPDIIAKLDQAATGFANIARILGEYYAELLKAQIPDQLAYQLVRDAQQKILNMPSPRDE